MSQEMLAPSATESEEKRMSATADSHAGHQAFSELPATDAAPVVPVGQQLRATREARNMSVADVAKALKLSVHQVVALEDDDWSRLPVTVSRGFVRNYARLLKLDPEPLMQALAGLHIAQPPELEVPARINTTMPEIGKVERRDYAAAFSGLVLVLVAVLAYFFLPLDFWQSTLTALAPGGKPPVVTPDTAGATVAADVPAPALPPPESAPLAAATAPSAPLPEKSEQPAAAQAPEAGAPSRAANVSSASSASGLKLSFSQPSWVEIRDRSGEVIFSQLNPAGSQREIEGQPPFALVIGNASAVTVLYKGKPVELSQRSKDDVARLNLD